MKLYYLAFLLQSAAVYGQQHLYQSSVSPSYLGNANPQLPLTYSPFSTPLSTSNGAQYSQQSGGGSGFQQYTQSAPTSSVQYSQFFPSSISYSPQSSSTTAGSQYTPASSTFGSTFPSFAPAAAPFHFPIPQTNPFPADFRHPFTTTTTTTTASSGNAIPGLEQQQQQQSYKSSGSSGGPGFMRLLLGSMGIHLGGNSSGGRGRKASKGRKPSSSTTTTVVSDGPPGPNNPVHVNNHLSAVQELAQQQHALVAEQTGASNVEYSSGDSGDFTGGDVTILHHHYPPSGQGAPIITTSADPPPGFPQAPIPPGSSTPAYTVPMQVPQLRPEPPGVLSSYDSNYPTDKPPVTASAKPSPTHYNGGAKSSHGKSKKRPSLASSLLTIYEQSKQSYEQAQAAYDKNKKLPSPPLKVTISPKPDSSVVASEPNASYADTVPSSSGSSHDETGLDGKTYTIVEKPVIHYIEKPVVRFVERTIVKTVEKPVIKYIEKPVYRYIEKPSGNKEKTSAKSQKTVTNATPPVNAGTTAAVAVTPADSVTAAQENLSDFERGYGGTYVRKNRPSTIKIYPSTTLVEDNVVKSPLIQIPPELPAYTPGPEYKAVKTHFFGPIVSGKDIPIYSQAAAKLEEAFLA